MGSGYRDGVAEYIDDDLGDFNDSVDNLRSMAPRRSRRKTKKNRAMGRKARTRKSVKHASRRSSRSRNRSRPRHSKRKGMSKEFLRQLRKKHGLGEFKRR